MGKIKFDINTERPDSRKWTVGDDPQFELRFNASGTSNNGKIRDLAVSGLPTSFEGLRRTGIEIQPVYVDSTTDTGIWIVIATYKVPIVQQVKHAFDTTSGTFHITQSRGTKKSYALTGTATDHKRAINAKGGEAGVEGVDIIYPLYNFSESYSMNQYLLTGTRGAAYKVQLFKLTGTVNNGPFRGFAAGEVLFMGATATLEKDDIYQVEFKFRASPNLPSFKVGDIVVEEGKRGWDYVWVRYTKSPDPSGEYADIPNMVYVEEIYEYTNFALLGIGTGLVPTPPT